MLLELYNLDRNRTLKSQNDCASIHYKNTLALLRTQLCIGDSKPSIVIKTSPSRGYFAKINHLYYCIFSCLRSVLMAYLSKMRTSTTIQQPKRTHIDKFAINMPKVICRCIIDCCVCIQSNASIFYLLPQQFFLISTSPNGVYA